VVEESQLVGDVDRNLRNVVAGRVDTHLPSHGDVDDGSRIHIQECDPISPQYLDRVPSQTKQTSGNQLQTSVKKTQAQLTCEKCSWITLYRALSYSTTSPLLYCMPGCQ
jgi:hypothetical protein